MNEQMATSNGVEQTEKPKVTPKDFFLWLGAMAALYMSAVSLILLLHNIIDYSFPSELVRYGDPYSGAIRFAIASLVVMFPLYVWLTRMLHQDIRKNPFKKLLWVRRWLIFITLFVAGATMAIDLIAVINTYLNGEVTVRFLLKALTILVVIGAGFWYYVHELRDTWEKKESLSKAIGAVVALIVTVSIVGSFAIIGSPTAERLYKLDEAKVNDLSLIQSQVLRYWQTTEMLPESLAELSDPLSGVSIPHDPQTDEQYTYRVLGDLTFELCATFNKESRESRVQRPAYDSEENWKHGEGETCFERTIDPERYPLLNEKVGFPERVAI